MLARAGGRLALVAAQTARAVPPVPVREYRIRVGGDLDMISLAKAVNKMGLYEVSARIDSRIRNSRFFVKPTIQRTRRKDNEVFYRGVRDVRLALRQVLRRERKHLGF